MWKRYRKSTVTEITQWTPDVSMDAVSLGPEDRAAGHPKDGDMVARNPANPSDMWIITREFFEANYVEVSNGND